MPDKPWIFRTYAGHSTARESNALYRKNLAKGQTGLSVAFDLPTQTGYDSDHPLAKGEVGKVGVPISHLGHMRALFDGIPLAGMNTSMTINATAAWLLALYIAVADEQGAQRSMLQGTTQNDIIKEYLSRGTYVFPPAPSMRLTKDVILFTTRELPKWNPINVCSYHLQEAGATCSFLPGTRRSGCRGRGTSNGPCACSKYSPTRPTCWSTAIYSTVRARSPRRSRNSRRRRAKSLPTSTRWAAR